MFFWNSLAFLWSNGCWQLDLWFLCEDWKSLSCVQFCDPMDYTVHGILQIRILEWVVMPSSRGSSQPINRTQFPTLQVNSLPSEPPGKPKNTGVGSLSLQWIFLTQESNQGLLHWRQILYQLNYKGSPKESWALKGWCSWTVVLEKTL